MTPISSAANPRYRRWLRLATQPRAVREEGCTLAEGEHLAEAVAAAEVGVRALLLRDGVPVPRWQARWPRAPVFGLAASLYDALALVEHGAGFALEVEVPAPKAAAATGDLLYLDGVQEPGNVGALLRVAAAAGVPAVWAAPGTAALWAPKALRGAQGAHFALALREGVDAAALRAAFAGKLIAATAYDAEPLWQSALPAGAVGWVFGSEGQGVSTAALRLCDGRVTIPLAAAVDSLNVATAAAVCLFERRRRLVRSA
ncbi:MAG: RNA methyltransferase [Burkholderiaceae bacterium]|nr:RNA methyltransferase [Burkholderiaceae bacterium]